MNYLVDTDRVVDYLKGRPKAVELFTNLLDKGLSISIITYGEIYEGIYFGQDPKSTQRGFLQFLRGVNVLPLNRTVMKEFARIRGKLRQEKKLIGDPDIMIAATAIVNNLTLISGNKKDFQRLERIKLFSE